MGKASVNARFAGKSAVRNARRRLRGRGARHNRNVGSAVTGRVPGNNVQISKAQPSSAQIGSAQAGSKSIGSAARGNGRLGSALPVNEPASALPANAQANVSLESVRPANVLARSVAVSALAGNARLLLGGAVLYRSARAARAGSQKRLRFLRVWNRSIGCGFLPRSRL